VVEEPNHITGRKPLFSINHSILSGKEAGPRHLDRAREEQAAALRNVQPIPEVLLAQLR
jgi:hypothetical protein